MQPSDEITKHFRLQETVRCALAKLRLRTINDLLHHLPSRYESVEEIRQVKDLRAGDTAIIFGTVSGLSIRKAFRSKTPIAEGFLDDGTGKIKIIWFNQPYLAKMLQEGSLVKVSGRVQGKNKLYLGNPEMTAVGAAPLGADDSLFTEGDEKNTLTPVYPESRGVTSKWFYYAVQKIFKSGILETISDEIPADILARYNLPKLSTALIFAHAPRRLEDSTAARHTLPC